MLRAPGVYAAQGDTFMLLSSLRCERVGPGTRVLDVGTGSGALAVEAARLGAEVTAVDVSRRALGTAWVNAALRGSRIAVHAGDLFEPVRGQRFDLVLSNPPYVPGSAPHLPTRGAARAWEAGLRGRALLDRLCRDVPGVLAPGGVVLVVHSALCDVAATRSALERGGLLTRVERRMRQPFGPVMRARADWFESQGLIGPGEREEELVVVRGEQAR
nr:HemK2/MTQ2 family protein methyltransferase [Actinospica durhamensis]